jgi:catechol 2,3-dioxygenase-like lactoylglutathione lyase family enzyme
MTIELNHTIVHATDRDAAAREVADTLGVAAPSTYGPFAVLELDNGVSLDFLQNPGEFASQHYAFLVDDESFDKIHQRIRDRGLAWWADPFHSRPEEINTNDGGKGLYWEGPDGHNLEIITRAYGSGGL